MPDPTLEERPVTTADGARSRLAVFRAAAPRAPVVVIMPAMGVAARFYEPFARALAATGVHAVTAELRGIGSSSVRASRASNFGYREMLEHDWPAVIAESRQLFPANPLHLLGHSLGGQLSACWCAANPGQVDGLLLVACCSVYWRGWDFPGNVNILAMTQAMRVFTDLLGYFPGRRVGFGGTEARGVIRDWAHTARTGRYDVAGSRVDYESLLPRAQLPVLALSLEGDHYAPARAVQNLVDKLRSAERAHHHLPLAETKLNGMKHFSWVKSPDAVVRRLVTWLERTRGAAPPHAQ